MADTTAPAEPAAPAPATNFVPRDPVTGAADYSHQTAPAAAAPTTSPLIVTSGSSRANYATNVNAMNTATASMSTGAKQSYNFVDASGKVQTVQASSPEEAMKMAPNIAPNSGVAVAPLNAPTKSPDGTAAPDATGTPAKPQPTGSTTNADGSTTNGDGTISNTDGTVTMTDGTRIAAPLKDLYTSLNDRYDQGIASAKASLSAAAATMQNDPAAAVAIQQVMAQWESQLAALKEKNKILLGGQLTNAIRGGGLQYANEMTSDFLSSEQDAAVKRVMDMIGKETSAVLKTQESYKKGDVAGFTAASKALENAQNGKLKAVNDLLTQTDKYVKQQQAAVKAASTAAHQQTVDDVRLSTGISASVADSIASSGITDEKQINAYIDQMASENGISNPELLRAAVVKARQANTKFDLSVKNSNSIIAKRGTTGGKGGKTSTDGSFKYTADDTSKLADLLNKGTTDGSYAGRGTDGYADPGAYVHAYNAWISSGGTPKGFLKVAPITNVNPSSVSTLPAALQPKTTGKKS